MSGGDRLYAVAINYTDSCKRKEIVAPHHKLDRVLYGSSGALMPYDAAVLSFTLK